MTKITGPRDYKSSTSPGKPQDVKSDMSKTQRLNVKTASLFINELSPQNSTPMTTAKVSRRQNLDSATPTVIFEEQEDS